MIITTKRPASILVMDTAITGAAWIAFIYQFTNGVVFLLSEHPRAPLSSIFGVTLSPTVITIIACLVVCAFNALVVYVWARLRKTPHNNAYGYRMPRDATADDVADHFSLSPVQLSDIRDSRVTVVYHSDNGGISHLETGDLHLQHVAPPVPEPRLRVA